MTTVFSLSDVCTVAPLKCRLKPDKLYVLPAQRVMLKSIFDCFLGIGTVPQAVFLSGKLMRDHISAGTI